MSRVRAAARNNAHWCHIMAGLHATPARFDADAWTAARRTPPFYPDAVTLVPGASAEGVLARIDTGSGCSVKDSFADLDLAPAGFRVLFEARWLHRPPGPAPRVDLPLVGYEHGDSLAAACRHGFVPVGPLRVWLRES